MIIYFENGKRKKEELKFDKDVVTLGRAPDNTILIAEEGVSRYHSKITKEGEVFKLHDLGSSNNTKLNGLTLHNNSEILKHKDAIRIGSQILEFRIEENSKNNTSPVIAEPAEKRDVTADKKEETPKDSGVFSRMGGDAPVIRPTPAKENAPIVKSPEPLPNEKDKKNSSDNNSKKKKGGKSKEELMKEMEEDLRKKVVWDEMRRNKKKKLQIISIIIAIVINVIIFILYQLYHIYFN
jgi:pSer/pThr/pTyr-binding forkhead associated (FHA) protein